MDIKKTAVFIITCSILLCSGSCFKSNKEKKYHPYKFERLVLLDIKYATEEDKRLYEEAIGKLESDLYSYIYVDYFFASDRMADIFDYDSKLFPHPGKEFIEPELSPYINFYYRFPKSDNEMRRSISKSINKLIEEDNYPDSVGFLYRFEKLAPHGFIENITMYIQRGYMFKITVLIDMAKNSTITTAAYNFLLPVKKPLAQEITEDAKWRENRSFCLLGEDRLDDPAPENVRLFLKKLILVPCKRDMIY